MIEYTIYNTSSGQILSTGSTQEKKFIEENINNDYSVIWEKSLENQYVFNNTITNLPDKPKGEYVFNYDTKQWEFDTVTADTKAKQKRDNLLAEGPDRISPIWWSSMTEQEQQAWTQYRQDLLDITGQADYPEFIVWPIKP